MDCVLNSNPVLWVHVYMVLTIKSILRRCEFKIVLQEVDMKSL